MNNKSKTKSNPFKNTLLMFFLVGSIVITSLGWIFYGEIAFKIIFSLVFLLPLFSHLAGLMKRRKLGILIAVFFF